MLLFSLPGSMSTVSVVGARSEHPHYVQTLKTKVCMLDSLRDPDNWLIVTDLIAQTPPEGNVVFLGFADEQIPNLNIPKVGRRSFNRISPYGRSDWREIPPVALLNRLEGELEESDIIICPRDPGWFCAMVHGAGRSWPGLKKGASQIHNVSGRWDEVEDLVARAMCQVFTFPQDTKTELSVSGKLEALVCASWAFSVALENIEILFEQAIPALATG